MPLSRLNNDTIALCTACIQGVYTLTNKQFKQFEQSSDVILIVKSVLL